MITGMFWFFVRGIGKVKWYLRKKIEEALKYYSIKDNNYKEKNAINV